MKEEGRRECSQQRGRRNAEFQKAETKFTGQNRGSIGCTLADHTATKTSLPVNPEALLSPGASSLGSQPHSLIPVFSEGRWSQSPGAVTRAKSPFTLESKSNRLQT